MSLAPVMLLSLHRRAVFGAVMQTCAEHVMAIACCPVHCCMRILLGEQHQAWGGMHIVFSAVTLYALGVADIRADCAQALHNVMQAAAAVAQAYDMDDLDDGWHALLNELEDRLLQVMTQPYYTLVTRHSITMNS